MEDKLFNYLRENITKKRALAAGILLLLLIFRTLDDFIEKIAPNASYRFIVYAICLAIWFFIWWDKRKSMPRNKKDYVGVVICITTENDKQKIRLTKDFAGRLDKLIVESNLGHLINVILLNDYQTHIALNAIKVMTKDRNGREGAQALKGLQKTINGHFYIYGGIRERLDGQKKYILDLESLVVHKPVSSGVQNEIIRDMLSVCYKQISFQEQCEFKGFEFTADSFFVAVKYIVGIAALVSGDVALALNLHSNLNSDANFNEMVKLLPNLTPVKDKLNTLLLEENYLMSLIFYRQGNLVESKKYIDHALSLKISYSALLQLAIIEFLLENNPQKALKTIYKAKILAKNDLTWRWSEAFLLMYLGKHEKALSLYKKISKTNDASETDVLREVYQFIDYCVQSRPSEVQCYFITGYLKFKKESNYADAYSYFEKFTLNADSVKHSFLIQRAIIYKAELESIMRKS
jgi:tetratricopeptide (TPR) repeat protein